MKHSSNLFALLMFVWLTAGCQQKVTSKLVGTWEIAKVQSLVEKVAADGHTPSEVGPPQMTIQFKSNGRLETMTRLAKIDTQKTGTWKLLEPETDTATRIECLIEGVSSQTKVNWINDSTIRLAPPNMSGQKIIFKFVRVVK